MNMRALYRMGWTALLCASVTALAAPLPAIDTRMGEQVVSIPANIEGQDISLQTTIFKPPGDGPFPVLFMNHGKSPGDAHKQNRARFIYISREFVKLGYAVVIPMRMGFAESGGNYIDRECNLEHNGEGQVNSLYSAMQYVMKQPWADQGHMLIAGQSHGGLTAIAAGSHNISGVKGVINFAGGLHKDNPRCDWQASLVDAFRDYGKRSTIPSLWFYGENDRLFGPKLAASMYAAYTDAGGKAQLVAYGPFKNDSHGMSASRDGVPIWLPETERFLKAVGMPADAKYTISAIEAAPPTSFAPLDAMPPYLRSTGLQGYKAFLTKSVPRAFALSQSGAWGWAEDGDDPTERALANCQKNSRTQCKLYAIDDYVVWKD
jgi:dienelactone hydrolase